MLHWITLFAAVHTATGLPTRFIHQNAFDTTNSNSDDKILFKVDRVDAAVAQVEGLHPIVHTAQNAITFHPHHLTTTTYEDNDEDTDNAVESKYQLEHLTELDSYELDFTIVQVEVEVDPGLEMETVVVKSGDGQNPVDVDVTYEIPYPLEMEFYQLHPHPQPHHPIEHNHSDDSDDNKNNRDTNADKDEDDDTINVNRLLDELDDITLRWDISTDRMRRALFQRRSSTTSFSPSSISTGFMGFISPLASIHTTLMRLMSPTTHTYAATSSSSSTSPSSSLNTTPTNTAIETFFWTHAWSRSKHLLREVVNAVRCVGLEQEKRMYFMELTVG